VFGLAFVVEVVVGYNPIMHKTQLQKLIFLAFCSFLMGPIFKPQPPLLKQTLSKKGYAWLIKLQEIKRTITLIKRLNYVRGTRIVCVCCFFTTYIIA